MQIFALKKMKKITKNEARIAPRLVIEGLNRLIISPLGL